MELSKENLTIGIIGGNGQMGQFFYNMLIADSFQVIISDMNTNISNIELTKKSNIVIISVPINKTIGVINEISPYLTDNQLIMDLTSIKNGPINEMLKSDADVISLHPMFGPSVTSIEHQTIVLIPARDRHKWIDNLRNYLKNKSVKLKITTSEKHDKMMALIQVLIHFNNISIGHTMSKLGFDIHETLEYTSPIYRMELAMIGRIFAQSGRLYGNIPMENKYTQNILLEHKLTLEEMSKIILTKDLKAFVEKFEKTSEFFEDFKEKAMNESNYLITQMVNYKENNNIIGSENK